MSRTHLLGRLLYTTEAARYLDTLGQCEGMKIQRRASVAATYTRAVKASARKHSLAERMIP